MSAKPIAAGTRIGRYEVRGLLGAGGMGEVYDAWDPSLGRRVAIKILPASVGADPQRRERFEREAHAAATLTHPNVVTVHSIEHADGIDFITMELVEGRPLTALIPPGGMTAEQLLQLAVPLADAVAAAHARGIAHRDLKPANVLVTGDDRVKVLDFGLAKVADAAHGAPGDAATRYETQQGALVGTADYMAPEQAEGTPADHRADLFALGIMLYEMAAGRRPFTGATPMSVLSSILRDAPPPLSEARPDLPPDLGRVIRRCLEKDPARRLQSAVDLRNELQDIQASLHVSRSTSRGARRRWALLAAAAIGAILGAAWLLRPAPPAGQAIDSVAVLPFANASGSADTDYLSDGLTQTITNSLAHIRSLRVVPRTLAARYRRQAVDPVAAGKALGARAVVTGQISQRGDRLHVQAELIDVSTVAQLWGEQFDGPVADAVSVQARISRAIAERLRQRLTTEDRERLRLSGTEHADAYQLYLKGLHEFGKRNDNSLKRAADLTEQAIALDPSYAMAHEMRAHVYAARAFYGYLPPAVAYPQARAAAQRALEIDDQLGEAHASLAALDLQADWNWSGSEQRFQRALQLDPANAQIHFSYGLLLLRSLGRHEEAIAALERAEALDPLAPAMANALGITLVEARRYGDAVRAFTRAGAKEPGFVPAHQGLARAYVLDGHSDRAIEESRRAIERGASGARAWLAASYARAGRRADADAVLTELAGEARRMPGRAFGAAIAAAALGRSADVFAHLERAFRERDPNMVYLAVMPEFDAVRAEPRFADLVKRVGIPSR